MCYLKSSLVAIGLNIGEIWFWDLNTSKFMFKDYDKLYRHDLKVRCIIEITHPKRKIEYLLSSSDDGVILVWVIGQEEMKLAKKNENEKNLEKYEASLNIFCAKNTILTNKYINHLSCEELNELNVNLLKDIYNDKAHKKDTVKKEKKQLIYKPEVKYSINVPQLLELDEKNSQIYALSYIPNSPVFFSGGKNAIIYVWDLETGNLKEKLIGHEAAINCLKNDEKKFLFSGSQDGYIKVRDKFI